MTSCGDNAPLVKVISLANSELRERPIGKV
jgi:hypothetical protein